MASNEYGLDVRYFKEKLGLIVRDCDRYTPMEMSRALELYAIVARENGVIYHEKQLRKKAEVIANTKG